MRQETMKDKDAKKIRKIIDRSLRESLELFVEDKNTQRAIIVQFSLRMGKYLKELKGR